ncbi:PREDICTED: uncharacterized protein LOC105451314 [Wasmannia auropunctata]|uniref:uncharacterized protein LOC105451314 n=1 Tax=Wasmannia auropunctata TaxID=64793 RepID=UPI0005EFC6ED|nr:PREDICTED: uncharacterized protein LOC105451314 [Wasmannia auropunctata]
MAVKTATATVVQKTIDRKLIGEIRTHPRSAPLSNIKIQQKNLGIFRKRRPIGRHRTSQESRSIACTGLQLPRNASERRERGFEFAPRTQFLRSSRPRGGSRLTRVVGRWFLFASCASLDVNVADHVDDPPSPSSCVDLLERLRAASHSSLLTGAAVLSSGSRTATGVLIMTSDDDSS